MNSLKIKPIASSSAGNCYAIDDGETMLLIECGIPIAKIRQGLDFQITKAAGCIISHSHRDHCKSTQGLMRCGVDCYSSQETFDSLEIKNHRAHPIKAKEQFEIGTWRIMPFASEHDCDGSLGFLLASGEHKVLFVTDSAYIPHKFNGVSHLLIECNYQSEILADNIDKGLVSIAQKNRLLFSHMSLDTVLKFLGSMDRSKLQEIFLMHLSRNNSNAIEMKKQVMIATDAPVYVCEE